MKFSHVLKKIIALNIAFIVCLSHQLSGAYRIASYITQYVDSAKAIPDKKLNDASCKVMEERLNSIDKMFKTHFGTHGTVADDKEHEFMKPHLYKLVLEKIHPATELGNLKLMQFINSPTPTHDNKTFCNRKALIQALSKEPVVRTKLNVELQKISGAFNEICKYNLNKFHIDTKSGKPVSCSENLFANSEMVKNAKKIMTLPIIGFYLYLGSTYSLLASMTPINIISNIAASVGFGWLTHKIAQRTTMPMCLSALTASFFLFFAQMLPKEVFANPFAQLISAPLSFFSKYIAINADALIPSFRIATTLRFFKGRIDNEKQNEAQIITRNFMVLHQAVQECKKILGASKNPLLNTVGWNLAHAITDSKTPSEGIKMIATMFNTIGLIDACNAIAISIAENKTVDVNLVVDQDANKHATNILITLRELSEPNTEMGIGSYALAIPAIDKNGGNQERHIINLYCNLVLAHTMGIIIAPSSIKNIPFIDVTSSGIKFVMGRGISSKTPLESMGISLKLTS